MTINEALSLIKIVRERLSELKSLRSSVATKDIYVYADREKTTEPQYDVKVVDSKIAQLETFLFKADSKIKQSNATTKIDIEERVEDLLEPLK